MTFIVQDPCRISQFPKNIALIRLLEIYQKAGGEGLLAEIDEELAGSCTPQPRSKEETEVRGVALLPAAKALPTSPFLYTTSTGGPGRAAPALEGGLGSRGGGGGGEDQAPPRVPRGPDRPAPEPRG